MGLSTEDPQSWIEWQINEKAPRCVRISVRKTFQNLLKLEKIGKSLEDHIEQFQTIIIIRGG
jgi:hypothetical protein